MKKLLTTMAVLVCAAGSVLAADPKAGQSVYEKNCRTCHGSNGAAPPSLAGMQKGRIQDLRSTQVQSMSDADLAKIITNGKGKMSSARSVSGPALDNLIAYLRTLKA
jgi:mono/diheme cytochrome c family protein